VIGWFLGHELIYAKVKFVMLAVMKLFLNCSVVEMRYNKDLPYFGSYYQSELSVNTPLHIICQTVTDLRTS